MLGADQLQHRQQRAPQDLHVVERVVPAQTAGVDLEALDQRSRAPAPLGGAEQQGRDHDRVQDRGQLPRQPVPGEFGLEQRHVELEHALAHPQVAPLRGLEPEAPALGEVRRIGDLLRRDARQFLDLVGDRHPRLHELREGAVLEHLAALEGDARDLRDLLDVRVEAGRLEVEEPEALLRHVLDQQVRDGVALGRDGLHPQQRALHAPLHACLHACRFARNASTSAGGPASISGCSRTSGWL